MVGPSANPYRLRDIGCLFLKRGGRPSVANDIFSANKKGAIPLVEIGVFLLRGPILWTKPMHQQHRVKNQIFSVGFFDLPDWKESDGRCEIKNVLE